MVGGPVLGGRSTRPLVRPPRRRVTHSSHVVSRLPVSVSPPVVGPLRDVAVVLVVEADGVSQTTRPRVGPKGTRRNERSWETYGTSRTGVLRCGTTEGGKKGCRV